MSTADRDDIAEYRAAMRRGSSRPRWTLDAGRCLVFDGTPLFTMHGLTNDPQDGGGYAYYPAELDTLAHAVCDALNAASIDGSKVARRRDD